jgi:hypothetical protein
MLFIGDKVAVFKPVLELFLDPAVLAHPSAPWSTGRINSPMVEVVVGCNPQLFQDSLHDLPSLGFWFKKTRWWRALWRFGNTEVFWLLPKIGKAHHWGGDKFVPRHFAGK